MRPIANCPPHGDPETWPASAASSVQVGWYFANRSPEIPNWSEQGRVTTLTAQVRMDIEPSSNRVRYRSRYFLHCSMILTREIRVSGECLIGQINLLDVEQVRELVLQ
jgi:hypothetical protein